MVLLPQRRGRKKSAPVRVILRLHGFIPGGRGNYLTTTARREDNWFCIMQKCIFYVTACFLMFMISGCASVHNRSAEKDLSSTQDLQSVRPATIQSERNRSTLLAKQYREELRHKESTLGPDHPAVALVLNDFAAFLLEQGQYLQAKLLFERALAIDEKAYGPDHVTAAQDLNNLAGVLFAIGEYTRAKTLYEHALTIYKAQNGSMHTTVAHCLNNLAPVFQALGEYSRAESCLERALAIHANTYGSDHPEVAQMLHNLASLYKDMGQYYQAEDLYKRSLTIKKQTYGTQHPEVAATLNNLAGVYFAQQDYTRAQALYKRALEIDLNTYGDGHPRTAIRLNNLAKVYYAKGDYTQAQTLLEDAYFIAVEINRPEIVWSVQFNLACLSKKKQNVYAAIFFGKQAVNTIQSLRAGMATAEESLQFSFLHNKLHVYRFLSDLLVDLGRLPEAQQVLDMLKEREYFDFLLRGPGRDDDRITTASFTRQESSLAQRYHELSDHITVLGKEMSRLKKKLQKGLNAEENQRYRQLKNDLRIARYAFRKHLSDILEDLGSVSKERYADIKMKRLDKPRKLQQALTELGHGAVAVHFLITEDCLRIILTTPEVQIARDSCISQQELNRKIMAYRRILSKPRLSPFQIAHELYQIVLAPIEPDLKQAGAQTLMLGLDGALRYIPIAALYDGESYVVERYRLVFYTPAGGLDIKDHPAQQWQAGGFGLTRAVGGLQPLPTVQAELEGIVRCNNADRDGILPGVIFLDEAFTVASMESVLEQHYPVIHIASHFELNPGTTESSHLVLGDGSMLTLSQIQQDDYNFGSVELLTLSACNTAVGTVKSNGSEIESFGTLAQDQGAKAVLATLWPVLDESTGVFMQNMYRHREADKGVTKAEALQYAQLQFIKGITTTDQKTAHGHQTALSTGGIEKRAEGISYTPDPQLPYAHPYYWAPFVLIGNWL